MKSKKNIVQSLINPEGPELICERVFHQSGLSGVPIPENPGMVNFEGKVISLKKFDSLPGKKRILEIVYVSSINVEN